MTRRSTDPGLSDHDAEVLMRLETTGWFVNKVAEDALGPGFAYSFGLYETFQHPEIIIFGLPSESMHRLINDVGEKLRSGVRYQAGEESYSLLKGGFATAFRQVDPRWYRNTLTWSAWFYDSFDFPALQLFWPDKGGRFPWNKGCSQKLLTLQPDLSVWPARPWPQSEKIEG